jgi:transposase-like protein
MAQHWLKSPAARDLPLSKVHRMTEAQAYRWFYQARWGKGEPSCAHCGVVNAYRLTRDGKCSNRFKCRDRGCRREFTVTSTTIFAHHKISFHKMILVMALYVHSVKGKAALQVCREAGVSYKCAWVMLMKLREALAAADDPAPLDGIVEIDGAHVNNYNRPDNRRMDRPDFRMVDNAAPGMAQTITALRQRRQDDLGIPDRVWATVTPGEQGRYAEDIVRRKVARTAIILSDEHRAYANLGDINPLVFHIRHNDAYGFGPGMNTNGVEGWFARVRRSAMGIHHRFCGTYLELYASSLAWHENTRRQLFSVKVHDVLKASMRHPTSRKFCGYWQGVYPVDPLEWRLLE